MIKFLRQLCWHKWGKPKMTLAEIDKYLSNSGPYRDIFAPDNYQSCAKCGRRRVRPYSDLDCVGHRP